MFKLLVFLVIISLIFFYTFVSGLSGNFLSSVIFSYKTLSVIFAVLKLGLILFFLFGIYVYLFRPIRAKDPRVKWYKKIDKKVFYLILLFCLGFHLFDLQKFYLSSKLFEAKFNNSFERVEIGHLYDFRPETYFNEKGFSKKSESLHSLAGALKNDLKNSDSFLSSVLPFKNQKLAAVYLMGFVSTVWPYGNQSDPKTAGCVFNNETDRSRTYAQKSFQQFMGSPIGCCTDYAYLLKALLDQFQIDNVTVHIGGHVFNQVQVDGEYLTLDANTNYIYLDAWDSIQNSAKRFSLLVLPHPSSDKTSPFYRPVEAFFQYEMISVALRGGVKTEYNSKLPDHLIQVLK